MKANLKTLGIVAISAAILYYPAKKLVEYIMKKTGEGDDDIADSNHNHSTMKAFSPTYRQKHNPNHRHS